MTKIIIKSENHIFQRGFILVFTHIKMEGKAKNNVAFSLITHSVIPKTCPSCLHVKKTCLPVHNANIVQE